MGALLARFYGWIIGGLLVVLLVASGALWWLWSSRLGHLTLIADLERDKAVQAQVIEDYAATKMVLNAHIKRLEAKNAKADSDLSYLRSLPGREAPLSDLLSAAVERVR